MRRCCEETLRVLRAHKESLLTIIEVFMHDPLYKWALSPKAARTRQAATADAAEEEVAAIEEAPAAEGEREANKDAERALLRIRHKLDGLEGGAAPHALNPKP